MVVIARKSWRTRRLANPTSTPSAAAMAAAAGRVRRNGTPAFASMAPL